MDICKSENQYISIVAPAAQTACARYGTMLPSVIIGQACLEVGYALPNYWDNPQVEALVKYNCVLGMKANLLNSSWADKTVWDGAALTKQTPEVYSGKQVTITDDFRKYESVEQCFCDYILFLLYGAYSKGGTPKYGRKVTDVKDPETLIRTINQKGYATNPDYWKSVMSIINKHNLTQYDVEPAIEIEPDMPEPVDDGEVEIDEPDDKPVEEVNMAKIVKLKPRDIIDVTARNKSQVPAKRAQSIKYIVCHYLGVKNADNENLYGGGYGGHYYISRTGKIYKAADPKAAVVWQCGGKIQGESRDCMGVAPHQFYQKCTNYNSLGIECGVNYDTDWYFSEESQESYVYLVSKLMDEYNIPIDRVIRHFGVTGKTCLPIDNTEVLTKDGWVQLDKVKQGDIIACYDPEMDRIIFDKVNDIVPIHESEVLCNRALEATPDHRMWLKPNSNNSPDFREVAWGNALEGHKQYLIKNGALYDATGLDLSDDELRLLVWIQGDGHYMKKDDRIYGLEFHLKKERKIVRIKSLLNDLDIQYRENWCENGSVHIRIPGTDLVNWAERWLDNKTLSYKLLEADSHQTEVFLDELVEVDGCANARVYTSAIRKNIDVVQALCALNARRSSIVSMGTSGKRNLKFIDSNYTVGRSVASDRVTTRKTIVSCVTVSSSYFLIRQNDNTFVVGNCPAPWVNKPHKTSWTWNQFKANLAQYRKDGTITVPDGNKIIPDPVTPTKSYLKKGDKGDAVKTMQEMLIYCGYSCGSCGADMDFGSGTLNAVLTFQRENGLEVDGYYGVKSKAKLEELYAKKKAEAESDNTVYDGVDYSPVYNYSYYRQKYEDLRKAYGTEKAKYFRHFCKYGMQEGRRGSASFDVYAYKNRYEDLQKAYGDYLPNYYRHYCKYGKKEGRKAT